MDMPEENTQEITVRKVSDTSKEYRADQEVRRDLSNPMDYAFGKEIISARESVSFFSHLPGMASRGEERVKKLVEEARGRLKAMDVKNNNFYNLLRSGKYMRMFMDEGFGEFLRDSKRDVSLLDYRLENVSDEILESMIVAHVENFKKSLENFESDLPNWQVSFKARIAEKIRSGEYHLSMETLERRIANTRVVLGDALRDDLTSDKGGMFISDKEDAMISQQEFVDGRGEKVYVHEMFHALSGRTIIGKEIKDSDSNEYEGIDFATSRVGLRIGRRFGWLNEAVTESLTQDLSEQPDPTYQGERVIRLAQAKW